MLTLGFLFIIRKNEKRGNEMIKKGTNVDLRIQRTQKAIKESFFILLEEKDFEHISVKDITLRAMISRNTFYLHYSDKYELLNKVCDDLIRTLFFKVSKQLRRVQQQEFSVENVAGILKLGIGVVEEDKKEYKILFSKSETDLMSKKISAMSRRILDIVKNDIGDMGGISDVSTEYIVSGITGVIKYYVNNGIENLDEECYNFTKIHLSSIMEIAKKAREQKGQE